MYGDSPRMPKVEEDVGDPISPYAVTKMANELYATCYGHLHGMETVGLRYFNVFGPRQDPDGAYAAVVPRWIASMLRGEEVRINGSGETSRDFCFVRNVVQANLLAATTERKEALNQAYNVAVGAARRCSSSSRRCARASARATRGSPGCAPVHGPFRDGRRAPLARRHRQGPPPPGLRADPHDGAGPRRGARLVRKEPGVSRLS